MLRKLITYSLPVWIALSAYLVYLIANIEFEDRFAYVLYAEDQIINAQVSEDEQWRILCEGEVPEQLATCLTLFEDQYFHYHPGINPVSIYHAIKANLKAGKIVRGGSTLTMQLARIHEHNQPRTYLQKIKEIALALAFELRYSKAEILSLYAQHAPYGGNTVGYCGAAQRYYQKPASLLSWSEAATLAVLPNAPSQIYPGKGQAILINKRNFLLQKLFKEAYIDSMTYRLAILEDLPQQTMTFPSLSAHLLQESKQHDEKAFNYHSTLDVSLQSRVKDKVQGYRNRYAQHHGIDNLAAIIVRNDGSMAAYVGNTSCESDCGSEVDILRSRRSPGSTLKPMLYSGALQSGMITSKSLLQDIPVFYNGYSPSNFDKQYRGVITAESALTQSLNIPAVDLLRGYGIAPFYHDLQQVSITTLDQYPDHYGLAMILGGCEVMGVELAQVYNNLSRVAQGQSALPIHYLNPNNPVVTFDFPYQQATAYTVLEMLKGVNRPSSQDGWRYFDSKQEISWKTGTSYGFRDAWSVGVTKDYTVLVWVGNADGEGKPGLTGIEKAAPILFELFDLLPYSSSIEEPNSGFEYKQVCKESGYLATAVCPHSHRVRVVEGSQPLPRCTYHQIVTLDSAKQFRAFQGCLPEVIQKSAFVLDPIPDSYHKRFSGVSYRLPPYHPNCISGQGDLQIVYPSKGAEILIPVDIDQQREALIGKVIASQEIDSLYWFIDHELLAVTADEHRLALDLAVGKHELTVVSSTGLESSHGFTIIQ